MMTRKGLGLWLGLALVAFGQTRVKPTQIDWRGYGSPNSVVCWGPDGKTLGYATAAEITAGVCHTPTAATTTVIPTRHFPHASYLYTEYTTIDPLHDQAITDWLASRFDWINVGGPPGPNSDPHGSVTANQGKVHAMLYEDSAFTYQDQMYDVQAFALSKVWDMEAMMMHSSVDVQYTAPFYLWSNMQQFDAFELNGGVGTTAYVQAVNGIFTFDGTSYKDVTVNSYAGAPGVGGGPVNITIPSGGLYVGYMEPYDQMNFSIASARVGGAIQVQYWNGSAWANMTLQSDTTSGLTASGKMYFWPPSDWSQRVINGSKPKFWTRIVPSSAWTTPPVYNALYGDDWSVSSGITNARGWEMTFDKGTGLWRDIPPFCPGNTPNGSSCIINPGTRLQYNANPNAAGGHSAKFKYQSRVTGVFYRNPNGMLGNPSNVQGGRLTWGDWLSSNWLAETALTGHPSYYDASLFDDGASIPSVGSNITAPLNVMTTFDFNQNVDYPSLISTEFAQIKSSLVAAIPAFKLGINSGILPVTYFGDATVQEGFQWTTWVPYPTYTSANGGSISVVKSDDLLPFGTPIYSGMSFANGLNDLTFSGTYIGTPTLYCVQITGTSPDTFSVGTTTDASFFGTCSNISTGNVITGASQAIGSGLSVMFKAITGHTIGDRWQWETQAQNKNNSKQYFTCWDSVSGWGVGLNASAWHYADLSNRTPLVCLAQYYLGWNVNTGLTYVTSSSYQPQDYVYTYNPPTTITAQVTPASTTVQLASAAGCAPLDTTFAGQYGVRIGSPSFGDTVFGTLSGSTLTISGFFSFAAGNTWAAGSTAYCIQAQHQSLIPAPPVGNTYRWTTWFPAMGIDLGDPNVNGLNHGYRMGGQTASWAAGSSFSPNANATDIWRRDFVGGIVFLRTWHGENEPEAELDFPPSHFSGGHPVCVQGTWPNCAGGPWYPLKADGTTGAATASVDLREAEAAILMTAPIN